MSKCPECGSDCNERDELTKAGREIERMTQRCVGARNALNAALHGDGALIDDFETAVANACVRVNGERLNIDLRIAAINVVAAFEQLGKAQHAPDLLMARSRCEVAMVKLSEALKA